MLLFGATISDEILSLIAARIQSNVRELEGALNQVLAMSRLTGQSLTPEVAAVALNNLLPQHRELTPDQIVEEVALHFNLDVAALTGHSRRRVVARPRQIAMYLIREETKSSLPQIGALLGGRDHSTIHYGYERIADLIEKDVELRREVIALRQEIYNNGR